MKIHTSIESSRGCGYRKAGGLYLIGGGPMGVCDRLPFPLHACPTCGGGIRQARGWSWIEPRGLFAFDNEPVCVNSELFLKERPPKAMLNPCAKCLMGGMDATPERAGLLWVGERHYPTPEDFLHEAQTQGVSKRISQLPTGFEPGKTIVFMAHPKAGPLRWWERVEIKDGEECSDCEWMDGGNPDCPTCCDAWPGVFMTWRPERIEMVLQSGSEVAGEKVEKRAEKLQEKFGDGFRAVKVIRDIDTQIKMSVT